MKKIKYIGIGLVLLLVGYVFYPRKNSCGFGREKLSIAIVGYGPFEQYIPQTGIVESDTVNPGTYKVNVPIDELYVTKISPGLKVTTTFNNIDYRLSVTHVYPEVIDGRFRVDVNFKDQIPPNLALGQSLRLRVMLSDSSNQILLPVGGFYKDTGGNWIYLVQGDSVVRRNITLGRKMGSEYFEVREGLKPGDRVITSSYENFSNGEVWDMKVLEELDRM